MIGFYIRSDRFFLHFEVCNLWRLSEKKPKQAARFGQAYIVRKYYCGWQYWCLFLLQSSDLSKTHY